MVVLGAGTLVGIGAICFMDNYQQDVPPEVDILGGEVVNTLATLPAPKGTLSTETSDVYKLTLTTVAASTTPAPTDWPNCNRTLDGNRFSPLAEITTGNVGALKVICSYDTGVHNAFETGLVMVDGALIGTTQYDTFSLDPSTCAENWRAHEDYPRSLLGVNRGVAYLDGALFRELQDGRGPNPTTAWSAA